MEATPWTKAVIVVPPSNTWYIIRWVQEQHISIFLDPKRQYRWSLL